MAIALTPRWKPLGFSAAPGMPLFDPVIVQERGLLIAGGPDALTVFEIGTQHSEFLTIRKKLWITGFTVSASSLYVQDGHVLLCYELTYGTRLSALNLMTGAHWNIRDSPKMPDSIYDVDDDDAVLQDELIAAREAHASALQLLSAQDPAAPHATALRAAQLDARGIDFSPPVIRKRQMEGRRSSEVFSLRMDGRVYAMDDALNEPVVLASEVPLRPELAIAEVPQPDGSIECGLYYVTADGGIAALDATGDLAILPGWAGTVAPVAERVLPLRFLDGMLVGGGILGNAFFMRHLNPAKAPAFQMDGPAEGWRQYDVAPADKLVLVSDGKNSRLSSYDPSAAAGSSRWNGCRASGSDAHAMFWSDTGADALVPSPKLILEVEKAASAKGADARFRVVLANTVGSVDPSLTTDYPPPATELDDGTLGRGTQDVIANISWMACRPIIAQHTLYCIVRALSPIDGKTVHAIAAFSLVAYLDPLVTKASQRLEQLKQLARPFEVKVTRIDRWVQHDRNGHPGPVQANGPYPVANTQVTFSVAPGGRMLVKTDAAGIARFDTAKRGASVCVELTHLVRSSTLVVLTTGKTHAVETSTMEDRRA